MQKKNILGVYVSSISLSDIVSHLEQLIEARGKKTVFGANPQAVNLYKSNKRFKEAINSASFIYPDGTGTILASKILGKPLLERTNLLDFIYDLLKMVEKRKWSVYILGGTNRVSKNAIANLEKRFPEIEINGHHGYFSLQQTPEIIRQINNKKPKILFVAMGSPIQEVWIHENINKLHAKAFFGIGGSIDVIAGKIPRGPVWLRRIGLEWLYRTYKEPKRLWRRYTIGSMVFLLRVVKETL